jgi:hypothetical protein
MTILVDPMSMQSADIPDNLANIYLAKGWVTPSHPLVRAQYEAQEDADDDGDEVVQRKPKKAKAKVGLAINTCAIKELEGLLGNLSISQQVAANRPYADISDLENKIPGFEWSNYVNAFNYSN